MRFISRTYLDWAAAAPVSRRARKAFEGALGVCGNPSSPHSEGRAAKELLEDARMRIARLAGTKSDAVVFTSGATESNALGITGRIDALLLKGTAPSDLHVLYHPGSHASVVGTMARLRARGIAVEELQVTGGAIDLAVFASQLRKETVLVCMDAVCGETGTLYKARDVRRVLDGARKEGARITLHIDASQAPLVSSFELEHLGADSVSLDAQKVGGVRGIGCLIVPRRNALAPLIHGGGQEQGLRPGTESPALAQAFAVALEEASVGREAFIASATVARASLLEKLSTLHMEVNEGKQQAPHILNISLPGLDTDYLVALLDEVGFAVSTRSACETDRAGSTISTAGERSSHTAVTSASRAVLALTGDSRCAESTLRISWGPTTRSQDLARFAKALLDAVRFIEANPI